MDRIDTVVFDLGGVVLSWEPERAYQQVMPADEVGDFMDEICFTEWNHRNDAGQDWEDGEAELISRLPQRRAEIEAYRRYFDQTITGMVPGTAALIAELQQADIRLVALTNWSADLFRPTRRRFGLLDRFEGIVVSGEEGMAKPDPRLFQILLERYGIDPAAAVFVDDNERNCATAADLGLQVIRFDDAAQTRSRLVELGLLDDRIPVPGPIFHLAKAAQWAKAKQCGSYYWSTRRVTYEALGYVHCAYPKQLPAVRELGYADLTDDELVVLQIDTEQTAVPIVIEADKSGERFPHLYGELTADLVTRELSFAEAVGAQLQTSGGAASR